MGWVCNPRAQRYQPLGYVAIGYIEPRTHDSDNFLEGHGDLASEFKTPRTHIVTLVILINNLLTKYPMTLQVGDGRAIIERTSAAKKPQARL